MRACRSCHPRRRTRAPGSRPPRPGAWTSPAVAGRVEAVGESPGGVAGAWDADGAVVFKGGRGLRSCRAVVVVSFMRSHPAWVGCAAGPVFNPDGTVPGVHEVEVHSLSVEKICNAESRHGWVRGLVFPRTQEVEEGAAEMNCRASRSGRMRNGSGRGGAGNGGFLRCLPGRAALGAACTTRDIQQYNRVTEGEKQNAIRIARAGRAPLGYRRPQIGRWSPVTHPRSPHFRLPRRTSGTRRPAQSAGRWC